MFHQQVRPLYRQGLRLLSSPPSSKPTPSSVKYNNPTPSGNSNFGVIIGETTKVLKSPYFGLLPSSPNMKRSKFTATTSCNNDVSSEYQNALEAIYKRQSPFSRDLSEYNFDFCSN